MRRDVVVADLDLVDEIRDREDRISDLPLLVVELDVTAILGGRHERRRADAVLQLLQRQQIALDLFETCRRQSLLRQQRVVDIG